MELSYQRPHLQILERRIKEPRRFIQAVIGPRQVGKTTLLHQLLKKISIPFHFISADGLQATHPQWISQQWETARIKLKTTGAGELLLAIDEIQKIENWSEQVKAEWDSDTYNTLNIKLLIMGSSRLLMQKGLTESLTGRFEIINVSHWSLTEMQKAFNMSDSEFVWFGGYPASIDLIHDENRWKDYIKNAIIETSISKDIFMMSKIYKPVLLKRLFELGCLYSGQILSFNKILGQLLDAGNTTTLNHYLNLLDTAGLLVGLEKFYKDILHQKSSSPKFQVYNNALLSSQNFEKYDQIMVQPEKWGRMVESAIGAHLINHCFSGDMKLFYWREGDSEMDFVLTYKGKVIGLEIKSGRNKKSAGIKPFADKIKPDKIILVEEKGLRWNEFLKLNPVELF